MRMPPLSAIEAFLAVAQARSFRIAAERLCLSPSALSRRIQALESTLGTPVIDRRSGEFRLTPAGQRYLQSVHGAVEALAKAARELRQPDDGGPIRVMAPQSLAIGWILPQLPDLAAATQGTGVELLIGRTAAEFREREAEIGVIASPGETGGLLAEPLIELAALAVGPPRLNDGAELPRSLPAVMSAGRLSVTQPARLWESWAAAAGFHGAVPPPKRSYESLLMMYEASAAGEGLCLAVPLHANRYLRERRLLALLDLHIPLDRGYALVQAAAIAGPRRRLLRRLQACLQEHAAACAREFCAA